MFQRVCLLSIVACVAACSSDAKPAATNTGATAETSAAACGDGIDNDKDGYTDCKDQDCQSTTACVGFDVKSGSDGADAGSADAAPDGVDAAADVPDTAADTADVAADAKDVGADVADAGPDVADAGPDVADAGKDVADSGPDVADSGPGVADSGPDVADAGPDAADVKADTGPDAVDAGPAACAANDVKRCWVECGLTIPSACILGDLPPRIPGISACQGGQWGACTTQTTCAGLKDSGCNPGIGGPANQSKVPAKWQCLDGSAKDTYFGCSGILGVACKDMAWFINWPVHECADFCADEQCATKGASEACEVHCNTADGPVFPGTRNCQETSCGLYWSQCFSNDACLTKN